VQLNKFEKDFESQHGRRIRYQGDIASVLGEWATYRLLKAQLGVMLEKQAAAAAAGGTPKKD
jgi:hypothetical protein